jgi:hypothetical protein
MFYNVYYCTTGKKIKQVMICSTIIEVNFLYLDFLNLEYNIRVILWLL